jgi:hypothetical protein
VIKIHVFLLLVALMIFNSCGGADHIKFSDKVVSAYSKDIKSRYNLQLDGSGGAMMEDIKEVSLMYHSYQTLKLEQARIMIVDCAENLLNRINSDLKIRPYLHNYPFTIKNIELTLGFYDHKGGFVKDEYIASVALLDGTIFYAQFNSSKNIMEHIHSEPYSEALKIGP